MAVGGDKLEEFERVVLSTSDGAWEMGRSYIKDDHSIEGAMLVVSSCFGANIDERGQRTRRFKLSEGNAVAPSIRKQSHVCIWHVWCLVTWCSERSYGNWQVDCRSTRNELTSHLYTSRSDDSIIADVIDSRSRICVSMSGKISGAGSSQAFNVLPTTTDIFVD